MKTDQSSDAVIAEKEESGLFSGLTKQQRKNLNALKNRFKVGAEKFPDTPGPQLTHKMRTLEKRRSKNKVAKRQRKANRG